MRTALAAAIALAAVTAHAAAPAQKPQTAAEAAEAAKAREELDRRVKALERRLELAEEAGKQAKAKDSAASSAGDKGFGIRSADGGYEFRFRGLLQADGRFFAGDEGAFNDTWTLRRVEPVFEFTLGKLAYLKIGPQFAGDSATTADVYGELRFDPAVALRFGKFKPPVGLGNLQGSGALTFIERGLPNELVAGRDLGLQLHGELAGGATSYAVAWVNGAADGRDAATSDTDNRKEVAARLFLEPFKAGPGVFQNLGFGIAGSSGRKAGQATTAVFNITLPRYRSPGQSTVFTYRSNSAPTLDNTAIASGDHVRWSPQAYFYRGRFGLLAEYVVSKQAVSYAGAEATFEHEAYQAVASCVLTGEDASYKGIRPATPYAADGGWGAFEVALRYASADFDDDAFPVYANPDTHVTGLADLGVALNWYLTSNARLAVNYDHTQFDGGAAAGGDRDDEKAFFTRLQLSF